MTPTQHKQNYTVICHCLVTPDIIYSHHKITGDRQTSPNMLAVIVISY